MMAGGSSAITGLDHAIVGVRDLEAAADSWRRLGFTTSPRGRHIGWATANYCVMFPGDYVELLGIADPTGDTRGLDRLLEEREGLLGLAFATDDAAASRTQMAKAGLDGGAPRALARVLELAEGDVQPRFELVHPPDGPALGVPWFVCRHLTPGLVRRPDWLRHANGALAIRTITIAADLLPAIVDVYRRLLGRSRVTADNQGVSLRVGATALHFARSPSGPSGGVGLSVLVADLSSAAAALTEGGAPFDWDRHGLHVDPAAATGVALSFVSEA